MAHLEIGELFSNAEVEEEQEQKGWEKPGYPRALWQLFCRELQCPESPEVINKAVILLARSGVTQRWQMEEMSLAELEGILPQAQHLREYLATKYVFRKL